MAAVWMDIFKDEIDEQRQEVMVTAIQSVMESLQVNSEKAMDVLKIPQNQRSTYAGLVKQA